MRAALSTNSVAAKLSPWGFDSIDSLKDAVSETTIDLATAINRGHSEIVAEESEKLREMQSLLSDVLNTSSNNNNSHAVALDKIAAPTETSHVRHKHSHMPLD